MYDIRMLGYHLKVPENTIEAIFHNKKEDIQDVVYIMLREWKKTQRTPAIAYKALWEALTHSNLNANDALVNSPLLKRTKSPQFIQQWDNFCYIDMELGNWILTIHCLCNNSMFFFLKNTTSSDERQYVTESRFEASGGFCEHSPKTIRRVTGNGGTNQVNFTAFP